MWFTNQLGKLSTLKTGHLLGAIMFWEGRGPWVLELEEKHLVTVLDHKATE
jgi:hypothetical protein